MFFPVRWIRICTYTLALSFYILSSLNIEGEYGLTASHEKQAHGARLLCLSPLDTVIEYLPTTYKGTASILNTSKK